MGETLEELLGCGKRGCGKWDCEQCWWPANGTGVLLELDSEELPVGKLVVAVLQCDNVQGHPGTSRDAQGHPLFCLMPKSSSGQSRAELGGKNQGPKSRDSKVFGESGRGYCVIHDQPWVGDSREGIRKGKITLSVRSCCPFPLWHPLVQSKGAFVVD